MSLRHRLRDGQDMVNRSPENHLSSRNDQAPFRARVGAVGRFSRAYGPRIELSCDGLIVPLRGLVRLGPALLVCPTQPSSPVLPPSTFPGRLPRHGSPSARAARWLPAAKQDRHPFPYGIDVACPEGVMSGRASGEAFPCAFHHSLIYA